jgi:crotonobetaine/carnitine-CoA ligase
MERVARGGWDWKEQDTVTAALHRAVSRAPDREFLDIDGGVYTYAQFDRLTTRFAHSLESLGVRAGDTVVTMLDNNADAVVAWLASNKICGVSVPINTALRGEFLRHQISDAAAAIVVCEADYLERITSILDHLQGVKMILYRGAVSRIPKCSVRSAPLDDYRGSDETPIEPRAQPRDLAALIYTSGTTGPSKGCMISSNYMIHLAKQKLQFNPATRDDVVFTPLPLFHMNALVTGITSTILVGGKIAIAARFSVSRFWPEVERTGATIASILGSMGMLLARAPDNDAMKRCFGQLHTIRGNPFAPDVKQIWQKRFGAKRVGSMDYGLTEAAVVTGVSGDQTTPPGSSGRRVPEFDVRIVDDEDRELPAGQSGEIIVRPLRPHIMFEGYWKRPADTLRVMRNMWFHTGDIGKFDQEGFFYFIDRKKDYLRRRGENISSFEMEATFGSHPAIAEVAVHAVLSAVGEDDLKVTAVLKSGERLTEEELCRWSLDKVPYYAVPRYIEFRHELPKNPQGRVLKYQLRDEGKTSSTWDIEASQIKVIKR